MGIFDEGCMGMFNAIIPDELLQPTGVFKERLSQSAPIRGHAQVSDDEAREVRALAGPKGMQFQTGPNEETDLTEARSSSSARCTSPRCASRTNSAATPSASSISRD